jgi:thioredoxin-like negative regulator of GroEL
VSPVSEARSLQARGRFPEAEQLLKSILQKNPDNMEAAMVLVRLYAQDLRQPAQAEEVLQRLEKRPHTSASHIDFARRSIKEWTTAKPVTAEAATPVQIVSLDEMLAQGEYDKAAGLIGERIREEPRNFALSLKLAEIEAVHRRNFNRAERIIQQLSADPLFEPEQIEAARLKLKAWREAVKPAS